MPYWLETDSFADDPIWEVLAAGNADRVDQLQAAYARLKAKASHLLTDGYLTHATALRYCRNRLQLLDLLCTSVLDQPAKLHRPGDECACLGDAPWIEGYAYRIHAFLRRNPSRAEYQRNRAQRADLRDPRLKTMVYDRDGGCCRYCRSGPLSPKAGRSRDRRKVLAYDHVDPDQPAGPDGLNLVTTCGRCNEHKGHRTPYEADMTLLPAPTAAERAAWAARGLVLRDAPDQPPITDETATEHRSASDPVPEPITDRSDVGEADPTDNTTAPVYPQNGDHQQEQPSSWSAKGAGAGRGGQRADPGGPTRPPPQPTRAADAPDIYHRRSRPPVLPARDPGYVWPPGAVPATAHPQEDHHHG
ncbi:HNH endonuclease [Micromonospora zamorensis]|uniref:HNH endonuclease n=1 Tax=Micromonospora zamorensis TaxID=709883 RepID=UPI003710B0C0